MKYFIELQINIKLHVKWQEIDDQGTEDINYKKKFDQLEKTIFELRLGMEAFTNNIQATLESTVKSTIQKVMADEGINLKYWHKL